MVREEWSRIPGVGVVLSAVEDLGYAVTVVVVPGQTRISAVRSGRLIVSRRDGDGHEELQSAAKEVAEECTRE